MRHIRILPLLLALLCTACHKNDNGFIELFLEPLGSDGSKLVVDNSTYTTATWNDGDIINFNGNNVAITRVDDHAYLQNVTSLSTNRACFPNDLASNINRDDITVSLPAVYHYRTSDGKQKVDMPMVARAADGSAMQFKHLTAALCLTISNQYSSTLAIDRIVVSSDTYQLNGERSVDLNSITDFAATTSSIAESRTVTMLFDREQMEIATNGSASVFIPIPPVGSDNHFTVTVTTHTNGTRCTFSKAQATGGALARNVLAYAQQNLSSPTSTSLFNGAGTSSNPFLINDAVDMLNFIKACSNGWTAYYSSTTYDSIRYYQLTNDIDMAGITITPIASFRRSTFNGNNKTIRNLTINDTTTGSGNSSNSYCGLFKYINSSTINGLTLENLTLVDNSNAYNLYMGSLGCEVRLSTFTNCHVNGLSVSVSNITSKVELGGLVSHIYGENSIGSCSVNYSQSLSISANNTVYGGLVAESERPATSSYKLTFSNDTVTNSGISITELKIIRGGGLIGDARTEEVTMTDCIWSGSMSFSSQSTLYMGGLVGTLTGGNSTPGSLTATNCTVDGTITASSSNTCYVAAYLGRRLNSPVPTVTINSCTNNTNILSSYN